MAIYCWRTSPTSRTAFMMNLLLLFLWHLPLCLTTWNAKAKPRPTPARVDPAIDNGTYGPYPTQHSFSSGLDAPLSTFPYWSPECADDLYYLLTPKGWEVPQPGPMILDSRGEMVWFAHFANEYGGQAYDLRVQRYDGEDYLTFWSGDDSVRGHGAGHYYMVCRWYLSLPVSFHTLSQRRCCMCYLSQADNPLAQLLLRHRAQSRRRQQPVRRPARVPNHVARHGAYDCLRRRARRRAAHGP